MLISGIPVVRRAAQGDISSISAPPSLLTSCAFAGHVVRLGGFQPLFPHGQGRFIREVLRVFQFQAGDVQGLLDLGKEGGREERRGGGEEGMRVWVGEVLRVFQLQAGDVQGLLDPGEGGREGGKKGGGRRG